MPDNLSTTNNSTGDDLSGLPGNVSPIAPKPEQSPLEENSPSDAPGSGAVESPFPQADTNAQPQEAGFTTYFHDDNGPQAMATPAPDVASTMDSPETPATPAAPETATPTPDMNAAPESPAADQSAPAEVETSQVPDTDQFLNSIMNEQAAPAPQESMTPPTETPAPAASPAPDPVENASQSLESQVETASAENATPVPAPAIKDEVNLDGIITNQKGEQDSAEKPVSSTIFAPQKPVKSASNSRLVMLIIIGLLVVGGGYYAYVSFFKSSPASTATTVTDSTDTTTTEVTLTNDEKRKLALKTIQEALENYRAAQGKYPVSDAFVSIQTSGNILDKELVTGGLIQSLPVDPDTARYYAYKSDGLTYTLTAVMDGATDPLVVKEGGLNLLKVTPATVLTINTTSETVTATATATSAATSDALSGLPV